MKKIKKFTVTLQQVRKFCKLTKDKNILHTKYSNQMYNNKFNKTLVPGIQILSLVNQILSDKYNGAILLDIMSNFRQPVQINEEHTIIYKLKIINIKIGSRELTAQIRQGNKIKAFFTINFIILKK